MTNPTTITPGKTRNVPAPSAPKGFQEFPKCVYGKSLDDVVTIATEEERPDGYLDYDDFVTKDSATSTETDAEKEAKAAATEAKKAEKEYRAGIMAYLDEHDVDYAKNLSTPKLEELKVALDDHLKQQGEPKDDAE